MSRPPDADVEQRVQQLFETAVGLPPDERRKLLDLQCGSDATLRREVEARLEAAATHRSYAAAPTLDPTTAGQLDDSHRRPDRTTAAAPGERPPPQQIGQYKLLEVIGEGGFGTVWVADQQSPVRRRVALKIIKPGMDSRTIVARFEQERQALAIMDHPNIAKVLDAGTAPDGRPYFVMEYVAGEPITNYCDRNRLDIRQRLELFIPVCEAVQHAHHKGVIHRDVKPSNVLVTVASGNPSVKVIDFGVAKALSHTFTEKTIFTEHGQILGTPEYMSPEQAEMGALDIDTRTDVYSLGVLLYELLTGALPFEPHDLRSRGYNEIQRIIREVDPPRPSARLRSLGAASADIAQRRHARLEELEGQLRRELEWIPLKAMRKDRRERYATPIALADDIRNHLAGRPLVAGPESALYRARKFITRNKMPVAAAAAVALALIAGVITSTIGFVRAARNAELYRQQYARADAEAIRANEEAARQRQVNLFIESLLSNANPHLRERPDVSVRDLLEDAVLRLDAGALTGEPRVEAAVRASLAQTLRSLSHWKAAEAQFRKSLELERAATGADSAEVARILAALGQVQMDTDQLDAADTSLHRALMIQRDALAPDDLHLADTINLLGMLADARGDLATAEKHYREAISIFEKHPRETVFLSDAMTNLATVLRKLGQIDEPMRLTQKALELRRQRLGERNVEVWNSLTNLASMHEAHGDLASAEKMRRDALALARELVREEHRIHIISLRSLAWTLWLRGGPSLEEAEPLQLRALELARRVDGEQSLSVVQGTETLACIARDRGQIDRAVQLFRQQLELVQKIRPSDHPDVATAMSLLADALTRAGEASEAIDLALRALEIRQQIFPAGHWVISNTTSVLGGAYAGAGRYDEAEPLLLDGFKGLDVRTALGKRARIDAASRLATLYEMWGKADQAAQWQRTLEQLRAPATQP